MTRDSAHRCGLFFLAPGLRALTDRAVPARGAHDLGTFAESLQSAAPRAVFLWGSERQSVVTIDSRHANAFGPRR